MKGGDDLCVTEEEECIVYDVDRDEGEGRDLCIVSVLVEGCDNDDV